jgi:23S rRNA (adenine2503-C2)-methyltransferase
MSPPRSSLQAHGPAKTNLLDFEFCSLQETLKRSGMRPFRAKQLWQWIWSKGCADFLEMTDIRKDLRRELADRFTLQRPCVLDYRRSADGTVKLLLGLHDGCTVETVLIPETDHYTQCLSSQVGCSLGCTFCSTGRSGFTRNMTSGEILAQVLVGRDFLRSSGDPLQIRNVVFMGMGEPLLNWPRVERSLRILRDPSALNFSHRRVTLSTVGVPGKLEQFGGTGLASLAVSLHAPTQDKRERIMPAAARALPLGDLVGILRKYPLKQRQRITVEYVLLHGVNDRLSDARELNRLLSSVRCKVNLICFNPGSGLPYSAPDPEQVLAFEQLLRNKGMTVTLRKSKGTDIAAACGQLKAKGCEARGAA